MFKCACAAVFLGAAGVAVCQPAIDAEALWAWPEGEREAYAAYERELQAIPNAERLRAWHDLTAGHVHISGTEGDWQTIEELENAFREMGLSVERHEFWAYLSKPVDAGLWIVEPALAELPIAETAIAGDPYALDGVPEFGFNAYAATGDVTAEVVYANQGTKEDFEKLRELGVDCSGKIVIARYGGNYRGFKVKYAEEAGAAGLLIYTDPADSGYMQGIQYPEGGWQTDTCIQRGSIKTTPWPGDPLTPFVEATEDAERIDPSEAGLPNIPVQPIGWAAARAIMEQMHGAYVPGGWQGGLPLAYRLTSDGGVKVRLKIEQERGLVKSANVIATLEGAFWPEEKVIIGCHHDSWGFGASDATSGMISLLESARSFAEMAKKGQRPARSIVFCGWGAEEQGIIGSVEWVEANREMLEKSAVAYLNLDMASMGPQFGSSASPSLKRLIVEAAKSVPQAREPEKSVYDEWFARSPDKEVEGEPTIGWLGGGSDHIGFVCHVGVASAAFSGGGSPGTAYHTARDTLTWYRQVVGEDYEPALMIARMTNAVASRLANAPSLPFDLVRTRHDVARELINLASEHPDFAESIVKYAAFIREPVDMEKRRVMIESVYELLAEDHPEHRKMLMAKAREEAERDPYEKHMDNSSLLRRQRNHVFTLGLPSRPWFKNAVVATDPASGYGAWTVPMVREAIASGDRKQVKAALEELMAVVVLP